MLITVIKHDKILGDITDEIDIKTFGQFIKVDRLNSGLSANEYAKVLGVKRQTVYNIESGQWKLDKMKMAGIAVLRGYDVNEILKAFYKEES